MIVQPARNSLIAWVFAALVTGLLVTLVLYLYSSPQRSISYRPASVAATNAVPASRTLVDDVELLKGQMSVLLSGAMESKIENLERSLRSGIISRTDLATVQELKEDLQNVKAYSLRNAATTLGLLNQSAAMAGRMQPAASLYSDELLQEISNMKNLFYVSIASWGIAIVIFGGTWMRGYCRLKQIQNERLFRLQTLGKPETRLY
ncbi:MAG: hypothetical protein ACU843_02165 [Gammaproteobacteria bacterium]